MARETSIKLEICPGCGKHAVIRIKNGNRTVPFGSKWGGNSIVRELHERGHITEQEASDLRALIAETDFKEKPDLFLPYAEPEEGQELEVPGHNLVH